MGVNRNKELLDKLKLQVVAMNQIWMLWNQKLIKITRIIINISVKFNGLKSWKLVRVSFLITFKVCLEKRKAFIL